MQTDDKAQVEVQEELQKMLQEVKRKLKSESKNELIRIISALLLDNYALKVQLAELTKNTQTEESKKNV